VSLRGVRTRAATGGLVLAVAALLAPACASEGDDPPTIASDDDATPTTADDRVLPDPDDPAPSAPTGDGTDGPLGAHPCDVADEAAVEAAAGVALGAGQPVDQTISENDLTWRPDRCSWEADDLEVDLDVAGPEDFPGGALACPAIPSGGGETEAVDDLGESAEWEYESDGEATLRVCTATALVDAGVEPDLDTSPIDEAGARATAEALVRPVLAALG